MFGFCAGKKESYEMPPITPFLLGHLKGTLSLAFYCIPKTNYLQKTPLALIGGVPIECVDTKELTYVKGDRNVLRAR